MDQGSEDKLRSYNAFRGHREGRAMHVPRANDRVVTAYRCSNPRCQAEYYGQYLCPYCGSVPGDAFKYVVGM